MQECREMEARITIGYSEDEISKQLGYYVEQKEDAKVPRDRFVVQRDDISMFTATTRKATAVL